MWLPVGNECSTYLVNSQPGGIFSVTNSIQGTADQGLYQGEIYQVNTCSFSVPNGNYLIDAKFAEIGGNTTRNFNVSLNGQPWLTNFSPYAAAGNAAFTAVDKTTTVNVTNGTVSLVFDHTCSACAGNAIFQALSILPANATFTLSVPYSVNGSVSYIAKVDLSKCTGSMIASGVSVVCPPITGNASYTATGTTPVTLSLNGLPTGCLAAVSSDGKSINITNCPPMPPTNATVTCGSAGGTSHTVALTWLVSTTTDVIGYNVYRSSAPGGPYSKLNASPIATVSYMDSTVVSGSNLTYYYFATAVDHNGESASSNVASVLVP
jgi:hypothetical protein